MGQHPANALDVYLYSVVRAMPNPRRGESINLGVILVAPDGRYSEARFGSLNRVRKLDAQADVDSIRAFLTGITASLPLHGRQTYLPSPATVLDVETLMSWSREFGGAVRVTEPRSVMSSDPAQLLDHLFSDYVGESVVGKRPQAIQVARTATRTELLTALDRSVRQWAGPSIRSIAGVSIKGSRAHHQVDRVLEALPSVAVAMVQAISFGSRDLVEVYGRRAAICLAAEDLRESTRQPMITAFAVHSAAPQDRMEAMQESVALFRDKGVVPVLYTDLEPMRRQIAKGLPLQ
jgi:Protein of unknown function (DUF3037)